MACVCLVLEMIKHCTNVFVLHVATQTFKQWNRDLAMAASAGSKLNPTVDMVSLLALKLVRIQASQLFAYYLLYKLKVFSLFNEIRSSTPNGLRLRDALRRPNL
jgi:hypothetical protein